MELDVIERVPALDGAHGAIERSVETQHALPACELEDESFENLRPNCGVHEWKRSKGTTSRWMHEMAR